MPLYPLRAAGDTGHISDHNLIDQKFDTLDTAIAAIQATDTANAASIQALQTSLTALQGASSSINTVYKGNSISATYLGAKGDYPGYPGVAPATNATFSDDRVFIQTALNNASSLGSPNSTSHYKYLNDAPAVVTLPPGNYYVGLADANGQSPSLVVPEFVVFDYSQANLYFELPKAGTYAWCGIQVGNYAHIRRGNTYVAPARKGGGTNVAPDSKGYYDALRIVNTDGDTIVDDSRAIVANFPGAAVGLFGAFITGVIGGQVRGCTYDVRASNVYATNPFGINIPNETDAPTFNATYANVSRLVTDVFVWGKRHTIKCANGGFIGTLKGLTGSETAADTRYNLSLVAKDWIVEDVFGPGWAVSNAEYVSLTDCSAEEVGGIPGLAYANSVRPVVRVDNSNRFDVNGNFRYDLLGNVGSYPGPNGTSGVANPTTLFHVTSVQSMFVNGVRANQQYLTRTLNVAADVASGAQTIQLSTLPVLGEYTLTNTTTLATGEQVQIDSFSGSGAPYTATLRAPVSSAYAAASYVLVGSTMTLLEGNPSKSLVIGGCDADKDFQFGNGYWGKGIKVESESYRYPKAKWNKTAGRIRFEWVDANGRLRTKADTPPSKDFDGISLAGTGNRTVVISNRASDLVPGPFDSGVQLPNGQLVAIRFVPSNTGTVATARIGLQTTTGGPQTFVCGLFSDQGNGGPNLTSAGLVGTQVTSASIGTGGGLVTVDFALNAPVVDGEVYWLCLVAQGATPLTLRAVQGQSTQITYGGLAGINQFADSNEAVSHATTIVSPNKLTDANLTSGWTTLGHYITSGAGCPRVQIYFT